MTQTQIVEYIASDAISRRVDELASEIRADLGSKDPVFVCVLKGAMPFFADLTRSFNAPCAHDYIAVSSYECGTESSGRVRFLADLSMSVEGRHVVLVEDIVDTGRTLTYLKQVLEARGVASLSVATLLDKPSRRVFEIAPRYVGFEIPDVFVIGYGMDFDERYRSLAYVGVLEEQSQDA